MDGAAKVPFVRHSVQGQRQSLLDQRRRLDDGHAVLQLDQHELEAVGLMLVVEAHAAVGARIVGLLERRVGGRRGREEAGRACRRIGARSDLARETRSEFAYR